VDTEWLLFRVAQVYEEYEAANLASDTMDLDDLVLKCAQLLKKRPGTAETIQHLFVDEIQVS
jgi:DNA helicase-2/ATP-dependent DNA helicase PcrA